MSDLQEKLGDGHKQIVLGFLVFLVGAIWGGMMAGEGMAAEDVYFPAVAMIGGAMITMLGISFGAGGADLNSTTDLMDALNEITARLDKLTGADIAAESSDSED